MSGKLALVTGATGLVASQVIDQLLQNGYRVRGTARGRKAEYLQKTVIVPGLEFVQIDDIATSNFSEALQGVDVVLHVASPLPGTQSAEDTLSSAVDGTLNILRQAEKVGIQKIVVTSSCATLIDRKPLVISRNPLDDYLNQAYWGQVTIEEVRAHASDFNFIYDASKILAEKAVWDFAREHPNLDIATVLPTYIYGPYTSYLPPTSKESLGSNIIPYEFIKGNLPPFSLPLFVDVRDVAKAHVLALDLPRAEKLEDKRFIIHWGHYTWKDAAEYIKRAHPEIKLADLSSIQEFPSSFCSVDSTRSREVLRLEYTSPEKTLDDFMKSITEMENIWPSEA